MLAARLAHIPLRSFVTTVSKPSLVQQSKSKLTCLTCRTQPFSGQTGRTSHAVRRSAVKQGPTLKERIMAPAGDGAFNMGKGLLAGASALGIGALCFYGLGMSSEVGAIDKAAIWPDIVKTRIKDTYKYFGGSLAITAASAVALARSPTVMRLVSSGSMLSIFGTVALMMGSGMLVHSIPYQEGFGAKQLAWMLHSAVVGAVVAPLTLLGGPLMVRAACYTAGIVGGLSTVAMCAPSEKFLNMGGPLAMGLGVVFMSSIGSAFLPPTTALGAGLYSVSMYGGLVLFGLFLLYDTQKIIKRAETHPTYATTPYDPVNNSVSIYMDTVNIFIRVAILLAGGGNRRK